MKDDICARQPYGRWLKENKLSLADIARPRSKSKTPFTGEEFLQKQIAFGFTREDLSDILEPMAKAGKESLGSMGADTPLAVLSTQAQHISNYFKQLFAQVSNPPIDPIRKRLSCHYIPIWASKEIFWLKHLNIVDKSTWIHLFYLMVSWIK